MKALKVIGFWLASATWGCIMTIVGLFPALYFMIFKKTKPYYYKGALCFKVGGKYWGGISLGPFFFVCTSASLDTIKHEWGHSIQNIIFGPLFPICIGIPSLIRCNLGLYKEYDAIWFEGGATRIGNKYYKKGDWLYN